MLVTFLCISSLKWIVFMENSSPTSAPLAGAVCRASIHASMWRNHSFTVGEVVEVFQLQALTQAVLNSNNYVWNIKKEHWRFLFSLGLLWSSPVHQWPPWWRNNYLYINPRMWKKPLLVYKAHLTWLDCIECVISVYQHPCNSQTLHPFPRNTTKSTFFLVQVQKQVFMVFRFLL